MKTKKILASLVLTGILATNTLGTYASYEKPTAPTELNTEVVKLADSILDKLYAKKDSSSNYENYLSTLKSRLLIIKNKYSNNDLKNILVGYLISGIDNINTSFTNNDLSEITSIFNENNINTSKVLNTQASIINSSINTNITNSDIKFPGDDGILGTSDDCYTTTLSGVTWANCNLKKQYQWGRNIGFNPNTKFGELNGLDISEYKSIEDKKAPYKKSFIYLEDTNKFLDAINSNKLLYLDSKITSYKQRSTYTKQEDRDRSVEEFTNDYLKLLEQTYNDKWIGDKKQGPCPDGWYIPNKEDFNILNTEKNKFIKYISDEHSIVENSKEYKKKIEERDLAINKIKNKKGNDDYSKLKNAINDNFRNWVDSKTGEINNKFITLYDSSLFKNITTLVDPNVLYKDLEGTNKSSVFYKNSERVINLNLYIDFMIDSDNFMNISNKNKYNNYFGINKDYYLNFNSIKKYFGGIDNKVPQDLFTLNNVRCVKK